MTDALQRFVRTALYDKNLPLWERLLRTLTAGGMAVATLTSHSPLLSSGLSRGALLGMAGFVLVTAFVGFCPACYFLGLRRSVPRRP